MRHRDRFGAEQVVRLDVGHQPSLRHIVQPSQRHMRLKPAECGFEAAALQRRLDLVLQVVELRVALHNDPQGSAAAALGERTHTGNC